MILNDVACATTLVRTQSLFLSYLVSMTLLLLGITRFVSEPGSAVAGDNKICVRAREGAIQDKAPVYAVSTTAPALLWAIMMRLACGGGEYGYSCGSLRFMSFVCSHLLSSFSLNTLLSAIYRSRAFSSHSLPLLTAWIALCLTVSFPSCPAAKRC